MTEVVKKYLDIFPQDEPKLQLLLQQIDNNEALDDRNNFTGHIAGDAVIFSPDLKKVLLVFHKRYGVWIQPGGHWDKGEDGPWLTASREAEEETGLNNLKRVDITDDFRVPLHIATGPVPASPERGEPDHWHHDFRYGYIAESEDLPANTDSGIGGIKWLPIERIEVSAAHDLPTSIKRMSQLVLKA
jgi:8-oxo-dGTP pyrophosphatase MutT (NUDIX family)